MPLDLLKLYAAAAALRCHRRQSLADCETGRYRHAPQQVLMISLVTT